MVYWAGRRETANAPHSDKNPGACLMTIVRTRGALLLLAFLLVALLGACDVQLPSVQGNGPAQPAGDPAAQPGRVAVRVVSVVDGDTIRVSIDGVEYPLRYIDINTPETRHPSRPIEWMGPEATAANEALVEGQTVYLEKDVSETDRYGHLLRYV